MVVVAGLQTVVRAQTPDEPGYVVPLAVGVVAVLAIGNLVVSIRADRITEAERFSTLGLFAFLLDIAAITALVWIYSSHPQDSTWVAAFVLPLEGAVRYGLPGALPPVAVTAVSQSLRELWFAHRYPGYDVNMRAVAFRIAVEVVVAVVAGTMARSLEREAEKASDRARAAEATARLAERSATREADARREVSAFHTAILAGVASVDGSDPYQSMAEAVAHELGCYAFALLVYEEVADERSLVARGVRGDPGYVRGASFGPNSGRLAEVGEVGHARIYDGPAEAIVPLRAGGETIGVLHERSAPSERIDRERLLVLGRLADQIALVTQAAELRARQEETLRKLRELDDMKSDFVAITSHELRTPLAAIHGFVDTLGRRMDDLSAAEIREFLAIIEAQTDRLTRLVEDLLVVSRIDAGHLAMNPISITPQGFLDHVLHGLGGSATRVELRTGSRLPDELVIDPQRLAQVLTNLLENALKFSASSARVVLETSRSDEGIEFSVVDHGPGIPAEELDRIFDRFHQTDAASTRPAEGAGLGLYITKQLVQAMGGRISVESRVGEGSTFTVVVPARPDPSAPARPSGAARAG